MDIYAFLGAEQIDAGEWRFALGPHLHGAFGGAFGGVIGAAALLVARDLAPGRTPAGIDCHFVRGLPAAASARGTVLHSGRRLSCVSVDLLDDSERLATRATISLVDRTVLRDIQRSPDEPPTLRSFEDADPWPPVAPIVGPLSARSLGSSNGGIAIGALVPWDGIDHSAEAACLPGDLCVGPPVAVAMSGEDVSHPNPDFSLRFCGEVTAPQITAAGRTERAGGGVAVVGIRVWSNAQLVAVGVSSSLLIASR